MAEEVIVSIKLEKGDNERAVDSFTKKITDLTKANNELKKSNNELIKSGEENSKEFIENTRQMEINKQKIQEATSSRKNLITTLIHEDDSIKGLNVRNAELKKQRDQLSTSTIAGRAAIADINKEIDKNNKVIDDNVSALEKQKLNIGNYKSALDGLIPGFGKFADGIQNGTKAALAFIATPLGAILGALGLAVAALTAYFKGSEEGQNRLNKITSVASAIFEQFMNVVEGLGKAIFETLTSAEKFGDFIEEQLTNRITGIITLIPKLGQAIQLLFAGKFSEAGKVAVDAVGQVVLGVENASDKIAGFITQTGDLIAQGISNGEKLAALNAKIDADERKLIVDREKTNLEVQKIRAEALELEGEQRKKVLSEAIALAEGLSARETQFAKDRLARAALTVQANGDDKEALKELAEAQAAVFAAETTAFTNTLKLKKEVEAIDKQIAADRTKRNQDEIKEAQETAKAIAEAEKEQFNTNVELLKTASEEKLNIVKEQYLNDLISKEEFETAVTEIEVAALIARKDFLIANKLETVEVEAQILDKQLKAKQTALDKEIAAEKKAADIKKQVRETELRGKFAIADASIALAEEVFGKNKAIATAEVILNTIKAVARAYADFQFPVSLIVSLLMGGLGAAQIAKINGVKFKRGGISADRGGVFRGPLHSGGGIPGVVGPNRTPIEFEDKEAIINRKSTAKHWNLLSAINQDGGGVAFGRGGVPTKFQSGSVTQAASAAAQGRQQFRDSILTFLQNMPPTIVTVEDINAKASEVSEQTNRAIVV